MIRQPRFWSQDGNPLPRWLLSPLGWLYGAITLRRMRQPSWRAPVPVVSLGNFTVGGGGKTPTALALAEALQARGEVPVFITRGYGGRLTGPVRVEPGQHTARDVGDEPLLLARMAPTIVARDRRAGAALALEQGATCLLLDDALQNPALVKDISLAVVDAAFGFGNGACLPAGPLRAPVAAAARHVDGVLLIGDAPAPAALPALPRFRGRMVAAAGARPEAGMKILAYCGLARPEKFHASLREAGFDIGRSRDFPDHHLYSESEAQALLAEARALGLQLMTTEKDAVRLAGSPGLAALAAESGVFRIRLEPEPAFWEWLYAGLESARKRASTASGPA